MHHVPGAVVGVLGSKDPVFGRALELLITRAGYQARFFPEISAGSDRLLDGVRLVLLAPGLEADRREDLLRSLEMSAWKTGVRVFEFGVAPRDSRSGHPLPWPCRVEDLKRLLDAALLPDPVHHEDDRG